MNRSEAIIRDQKGLEYIVSFGNHPFQSEFRKFGGLGGMESSLRGKSDSVPPGPPKAHNSQEMVEYNQYRDSLDYTSALSEENITILNPSVKTKR